MKEENQNQEDLQELIQKKLYLTKKFENDIYAYMEKAGFSNFSAFIRLCTRFYMYVIAPIDSNKKTLSLSQRLQKIESQLDQVITEEHKIEEKALRYQEQKHILEQKEKIFDDRISKQELDKIENYDTIREDIISQIEMMDNNEIKEFVLMGKLKEKYEEKTLWLSIIKMQIDRDLLFDKTKGKFKLII